MLLGLDTETTGLDSYHGCRPFFVSTCDEDGRVEWWEWDVDPFTRTPLTPKEDVRAIGATLGFQMAKPGRREITKRLILHNAKFDIRMLEAIGCKGVNWDSIDDTLIAHHCLASTESHKLKDLCLQYLDVVEDDQKALQDATLAARRIAEKKGWRVAKPFDPHFPAVKRAPKEGWWVYDTWLPRAVAKADKYPADHPWWTVLKDYALLDAERAVGLWWTLEPILKREKLWEQYQVRRKLLAITSRMEEQGVTGSIQRNDKLAVEFKRKAAAGKTVCEDIAKKKLGWDGAAEFNVNSKQQIQWVLFDKLGLEPIKENKTGYSVDKDTIKALRVQIGVDPQGHAHKLALEFINGLGDYTKCTKANDYLEGYQLHGIKIGHRNGTVWFRIHPSFNITGTGTTRLSSDNPNTQNVSKGQGEDDFNLRFVFGPIPGRRWYSYDFSNIEMRIPAYLAGEDLLIKLFEEGGSYHLLIGELLHPELFKRLGPAEFKKTIEYRRVKNGNFAHQYGGQESTVDLAFGVAGAYKKIRKRFPKITKLSDSCVAHANLHGYIVTLGGYRLQCPKTERGGVKPTTPFNYFTQGSAGWAMIMAMVRCDEQIQAWNEGKPESQHIYMILTIHDELIFDFPVGMDTKPKLRRLQLLMEESGRDFGFPLPVEVDVINNNWKDETPWVYTTVV